MQLQKWNFENEQFLAACSTRYGRQAAYGELISSYLAPNAIPGGQRSPHVRYGPSSVGHVQADQVPGAYGPAFQSQLRMSPRSSPTLIPKPFPGLPTRRTTLGPQHVAGYSAYGYNTDTQSRLERSSGGGQSSLREVQNASSPPRASIRQGKARAAVNDDGEENEPGAGNLIISRVPQSKSTQAVRMPINPHISLGSDSRMQEAPKMYTFVQSGMRTGQGNKSDKKDQLEDEIVAAKLPAPTISDQALRAAGVMPKPKQVDQLQETENSLTKPKGRPKKALFPAEGIRVSGSFGNALLAAGAKDARPHRPATASSNLKSQIAPSSNQSRISPAPKKGCGIVDLTKENDVPVSTRPRMILRFNTKDSSSSGGEDKTVIPKGGKHLKSASDEGEKPVDDPKGKVTARKTSVVPARRGSSVATAKDSPEKRPRR